jgi:hypothetical protein
VIAVLNSPRFQIRKLTDNDHRTSPWNSLDNSTSSFNFLSRQQTSLQHFYHGFALILANTSIRPTSCLNFDIHPSRKTSVAHTRLFNRPSVPTYVRGLSYLLCTMVFPFPDNQTLSIRHCRLDRLFWAVNIIFTPSGTAAKHNYSCPFGGLTRTIYSWI